LQNHFEILICVFYNNDFYSKDCYFNNNDFIIQQTVNNK
jgi:hypothetical protein